VIRVRVLHKAVEAEGICSFELAADDGRPLPAFSAGSHVDVQVADGLTRQYSLCNDSAETHRYLIGVLREPASRGGSTAMHDRVQVGDVIQISAPKNHFALAHEAQSHLLLAGGIGITPILCMAERLAQTGADFALHYCTRSAARTAFAARIRASAFTDKVAFHHDDGDAAQKIDIAALLAQPQAGTHVYVCGPKGFMDAVLGTARANGWPESQLHFEFFSADVQPRDADEAFDVKLASSGRVVHIPKGVTVLNALADAGIVVPSSCEQGVCGTCITRVIEGVPDHRDMYFTPEEQAANAEFTPCCSRSKTPLLVLDL
jgi:vanillate O-demethylase ferredoxin subunit